MNTNFPQTKVGSLDFEVNRLSKVFNLYQHFRFTVGFKILAFVTLTLALTLVGLDGFRGLWYIYFVRFIVIFSSIIPIRYLKPISQIVFKLFFSKFKS